MLPSVIQITYFIYLTFFFSLFYFFLLHVWLCELNVLNSVSYVDNTLGLVSEGEGDGLGMGDLFFLSCSVGPVLIVNCKSKIKKTLIKKKKVAAPLIWIFHVDIDLDNIWITCSAVIPSSSTFYRNEDILGYVSSHPRDSYHGVFHKKISWIYIILVCTLSFLDVIMPA